MGPWAYFELLAASYSFLDLHQWPRARSAGPLHFTNQKSNNTMAIQWKVDPAHSELQFKVRHLMITNVTGTFKSFDITAETEQEDFSKATLVNATADIDSIQTNNEQRDAHLKSDDFFNAEQFPQLIFKATGFDPKTGKLNGDLTIREVTKPISLDVEFHGIIVDPYGQTKAGFSVSGKVSRKEYNLKWNAVTEAGQVVVSDDIRINAEVQLIKQ